MGDGPELPARIREQALRNAIGSPDRRGKTFRVCILALDKAFRTIDSELLDTEHL